MVNFPFLDGDVPRRPSYGLYISQLIRFASVCSHVQDFGLDNVGGSNVATNTFGTSF